MKPKFKIGELVQTKFFIAPVEDIAMFADHVEYLVRLPKGTASWIHENQLSAATEPAPATKPSTAK